MCWATTPGFPAWGDGAAAAAGRAWAGAAVDAPSVPARRADRGRARAEGRVLQAARLPRGAGDGRQR
ncbi:hypothetical protein G6F24_018952 [Rhizopus arrhizus]|nr:hypothetical protein G6F24_018952 [Rhizopus arrhizus]